MGQLRELVIRTGDDAEIAIHPRKSFLGWLPARRDLIIMTRMVGRASQVSPSVVKLHRRFHNADPKNASTFEWPDRRGRLTDLGLVVSLIYTIPPWLRSPEKKRYQWNHEFGDHGERGHGIDHGRGNYPERYMPLLQIDEAGHFYIKRRRGNRFYVKDWLYW